MSNNLIIKPIFLVFILFLILFVSCSSKNETVKISKKSKNNFLAYYNTFFMAEKSFNDAVELMQINIKSDNNLSSQVDNLLNIAIENALIIEKDFYQTKYIDDAYFILGMSSYYKNRITAANYYFQRLLDDYPQSSFLNTVNIQMGFIDLKIGKINSFENRINLVELNRLNNTEKFKYYDLMAYYYEYFDDIILIKENYFKALDYTSTKQERIFIYSKLLEISESINDKENSILYIEGIQKNNVSNIIDKELIIKWIKYKHHLTEHEDVINKLEELFLDAITLKDKLFYQIGIARANIFMHNYDLAEKLLNDLIENNKTSTVIKNEFSEIYYLLGEIGFINKDYSKAQAQYQLSIDSARTSEYGKKSQDKINALISYSNYIEEINFINFTGNEDDTSNNDLSSNTNNLDSLLFHLGQTLFFDLDMKDSSLYSFKKIIEDFPESKYRYKTLVVLSMHDADTLWSNMLKIEYPVDEENKLDEVSLLIDNAWNLVNESYEKCIDEFVKIYENYNNDKALYIIAFIYDTYQRDIMTAMQYYKIYLEEHIDGEFYKTVNNRVADIKNMYEEQINILEQKINYKQGFDYLKNQVNIDSSLFYLDLAKSGKDRELNLESRTLYVKVNEYINNMNLYNTYIQKIDSSKINIDSVRINLAEILYSYFDVDSLSEIYYLEIIKNDNNFKDMSYAALSVIDSLGEWNSLLYNLVSDSVKFNELINNVTKGDHLLSLKSIDLNLCKEDYSWLNNAYDSLFKDKANIDSLAIDTLSNKNNSINEELINNINIDTMKIEKDTLIKNNLLKEAEFDSLNLLPE